MIIVLGSETLSLVEMGAFLSVSLSVGFGGESRVAIYRWAERLLCDQEYLTRKRRARGLIKAYMERMTGLSRAQCTRLIAQYAQTGRALRRGAVLPYLFPTYYSQTFEWKTGKPQSKIRVYIVLGDPKHQHSQNQ